MEIMKPLAGGERVRLRSGGPRMTVQFVDGQPDREGRFEFVACYWFDQGTMLQKAIFRVAGLVVDEGEDGAE